MDYGDFWFEKYRMLADVVRVDLILIILEYESVE